MIHALALALRQLGGEGAGSGTVLASARGAADASRRASYREADAVRYVRLPLPPQYQPEWRSDTGSIRSARSAARQPSERSQTRPAPAGPRRPAKRPPPRRLQLASWNSASGTGN